jgi:hypothetical protein
MERHVYHFVVLHRIVILSSSFAHTRFPCDMGAHLVPATSLRLHEVVFFQAVARDVGEAGDNIAEDIVSATTGRLT